MLIAIDIVLRKDGGHVKRKKSTLRLEVRKEEVCEDSRKAGGEGMYKLV